MTVEPCQNALDGMDMDPSGLTLVAPAIVAWRQEYNVLRPRARKRE
jgi:hypothetical protein